MQRRPVVWGNSQQRMLQARHRQKQRLEWNEVGSCRVYFLITSYITSLHPLTMITVESWKKCWVLSIYKTDLKKKTRAAESAQTPQKALANPVDQSSTLHLSHAFGSVTLKVFCSLCQVRSVNGASQASHKLKNNHWSQAFSNTYSKFNCT